MSDLKVEARWNTNRCYTLEGQILQARLEPDGSVLFADLSRQVYGRIPAGKYAMPPYTPFMLRMHVMNNYDKGNYTIDRACNEYLQECMQA